MISKSKLFLTLSLITFTASAQVSYSPLVVTGTRIEQSQSSEVSHLSVITEQFIESSLDSDASRLIGKQAGVDISSARGRPGARPAIQGFSGERVLIVVDDLPQYGEQFDLQSLPMADIEQIEILRGASSALYGNQALAGVIHIRTKNKRDGLQTRVRALGSDDSSHQGQIHLNSSIAKLYHQQTKSLPNPDPRLVNASPSKIYRSQQGLSFSLDEFLPINLELNWRQSLSKSNFQALSSETSRDNNTRSNDQTYGAKLEHSINRMLIHFHFQHQAQDEELDLNNNPQTPWSEQIRLNDYRFQSYEAQLQGPIGRNTLTLGASHQRESYTNDTRLQFSPAFIKEDREVDQTRHQSALYFQNQTMYDHFDVVTGVRLQDDSLDRLRIAPKLASLIVLHDSHEKSLIMRPSFGIGYRYPTLRERHALIDHRSFANYLVRGNKDLRPERAWSLQWAIDYRTGPQRYQLNGFFNRVQDLIQTKRNEEQTTYEEMIYQNVSRARTYGVEASAIYQVYDTSSIQLNYTLLKTQNRDLNKSLPFQPAHTVSASLTNQWNQIKLTTDISWRSSEYLDDSNRIKSQNYATADMRASYQIQNNSRLLARIDNIFDITRQAISGTNELDTRPANGRQFFLGLEVTL